MEMDLAAVTVLLEIDAGEGERSSDAVGMDLRIRGHIHTSQVFRFHMSVSLGGAFWSGTGGNARLPSGRMARLIASFFGSGLILGRLRGSHGGSGTVGGLLALVISVLLPPVYGRLAALGATIVLGIWSIQALKLG